MYYQQPAGLPAGGQDSGSGSTMQMLMQLYGQQAPAAAAATNGVMGLNEYNGQGFNPAGASDAATGYMNYNTGIYGRLGVEQQSSSY
jgi:hypothetical protein